jgi:hypothetical protein
LVDLATGMPDLDLGIAFADAVRLRQRQLGLGQSELAGLAACRSDSSMHWSMANHLFNWTRSSPCCRCWIARFDRLTADGLPRSLAVGQALDRPPADKYRLGADRTFAGLAALCDASAVAGRDLIRQLAFAYLTGNGDAHAKNFSVLQGLDGEWRIAPA